MRVLLAHKFYNLTGGAEFFFHEVGRVLQENGHEVAYYSTNNDNRYEPDGKKVYWGVDVPYKDVGILSKVKNLPKMFYSKENKAHFKKVIEEFKPDIIHVFAIYVTLTPSILEAAKESGIPVIMSSNDYKVICPNYKLFHHGRICEDCKGGKYLSAIKNKCCQNSLSYSIASALEAKKHAKLDIWKKNIDLFLFASDFMAYKVEDFWGKGSFQWDKLLNPFDSQVIIPTYKYEDYIVYFGRIIDEKGVDVLVKAVNKADSKVKLVVIGEGPDQERCESLANKDKVQFVGPKWGEELNQLLANCKFVVIPSVWHENFPYVILQSFAQAKAVIGTNRGGIPELVKEGEFGYIYDALNEEELASKINKLYFNDELAEKMGVSAKKWCDKTFNDEVFYSSILKAYNKVLN